ncbi:hypothetical protein JEP64_03580 [Proteus vulgaris]|uniref:hypothetical protein n=1 Tax=Proteus TaxID=583 RepID=UPI0018E4189B|nr:MULTISPECIES: hypothetical protein [Proteus]MBI6215672.1 hypothetical protein [Proteus vulgaris]
MEINSINVTRGIYERITSSIENKFSQLANIVVSIKNSAETLFVGSEAKRQQNINKTCGEFIQRISTKTKNDEYEKLDAKKLNDSGCISTKLTHKTLTNDVTKLFSSIKNELLNQTKKSLSVNEGHSDKSVNIMLATLYQVYQQANEHFQKNINPGHNDLLKSQIFELINNNFTIKSDCETTQNDNIIALLKNINEKYQGEIELLKRNVADKINHKLEKNRIIQQNLEELNL